MIQKYRPFFSKSAEDIEADKRQKEQDRIKKEIRRESKWLRMIDEWKTRHPAKLPVRIWKGVPEKLRAAVSILLILLRCVTLLCCRYGKKC